MEPSIYQYPAIFRRVHMEQPGEIEEEAQFLLRVWKRRACGPVRRVLDVASGNSPHGQILAREGVEVVGVDCSAAMIAAGRTESRGLAVKFYRRRIEEFSLPENAFDAAILMSETFPIITGNHDLISHLRSVGRLLKRGGLYCIDVDRMDSPRTVRARKPWQRRRVQVGDALVYVRTYHRPFAWDSGLHSVFELECEIHFPGGVVTTRDILPIRYTLPATLELAAKASGMFEMIAAYSDLSFTAPLRSCERRWLGVLRRL